MLKNPLTMVGTIDRCWLLTFQTPIQDALPFLPGPLLPVTHRGCAFWNVVVSHIDGMRPKGAPKFFGTSYIHVGYRLYVRYPVDTGEEIPGLYFVRSDCDGNLMSIAGNLMTDFNFHPAPVRVVETGGRIAIDIDSPDAPASAVIRSDTPAVLPAYSAFDNLDQAARFLKYKPFGISVDASGRGNIVRIVRDERAWRARLVHVDRSDWAFLADKNVRPEICYEVDPIDYQWNRAYTVRPAIDASASVTMSGPRMRYPNATSK